MRRSMERLLRERGFNAIPFESASALLSQPHDFDLDYGLFFAFLITTIIWLYDAFRPVYDLRLGTHGAPERAGVAALA